MRIGSLLLGGILGAVTVMYFSRSNRQSQLQSSTGNSQNMQNNWFQRVIAMFTSSSAKPSALQTNSNATSLSYKSEPSTVTTNKQQPQVKINDPISSTP